MGTNVRLLRRCSQLVFAALCVWIGIEFHFFVRYLESGGQSMFMQRPPGAEAFLPISSFMSLCYFIQSGDLHPFHPAGLVIFCAIIFVSWVFGKSFCGWICPIGLLTEVVYKLRRCWIPRKLALPKWIDAPARGLKYLMLAFFVWVILHMPLVGLKGFLDGGYNLLADVKMYYFFAKLSITAAIVIVALVAASAVLSRFWCRYLCPYGALLGIVSLLSPHKIKRTQGNCTECGRCTKVCPAGIRVAEKNYVISDECLACMECVNSCPEEEALELRNVVTREPMLPRTVAVWIIAIFIFLLVLARLVGFWHNRIPIQAYHHYFPQIHELDHPRGIE